jgi:CO/xanthine dehydrogenase Mo-binding subunit
MVGHVVSLPLAWETPLRTGNLRDPNAPQSTFAAESFIDELAAAAKADPMEFRMKLLTGTLVRPEAIARGTGVYAGNACSARR